MRVQMKLEREYSQRRESSALKICGVDLRLVGLNGRDKFIHIVLSARHPLDRTRLVMTREGAQQGTHVCTDPIPCSAGAFRFADKTIARHSVPPIAKYTFWILFRGLDLLLQVPGNRFGCALLAVHGI